MLWSCAHKNQLKFIKREGKRERHKLWLNFSSSALQHCWKGTRSTCFVRCYYDVHCGEMRSWMNDSNFFPSTRTKCGILIARQNENESQRDELIKCFASLINQKVIKTRSTQQTHRAQPSLGKLFIRCNMIRSKLIHEHEFRATVYLVMWHKVISARICMKLKP